MGPLSIPPVQPSSIAVSPVKVPGAVGTQVTLIAIATISAVGALLTFLGWLMGPDEFPSTKQVDAKTRTPSLGSSTTATAEIARFTFPNLTQDDKVVIPGPLVEGLNNMPDDGDCLLHSFYQTASAIDERHLDRRPGNNLTNLRREIATYLLDQIREPINDSTVIGLLNQAVQDYNLRIRERIAPLRETREPALKRVQEIPEQLRELRAANRTYFPQCQAFLNALAQADSDESTTIPEPPEGEDPAPKILKLEEELKDQNKILSSSADEVDELQNSLIKNEGSHEARVEYLTKILQNSFFLGQEALYALHKLYGVNIKVRSKENLQRDYGLLGASDIRGRDPIYLVFSNRARGPHYDAFVLPARSSSEASA